MTNDVDFYSATEEECQAFKKAKAINMAYIVKDGWIVRVYADNHIERIKKIDNENISK